MSAPGRRVERRRHRLDGVRHRRVPFGDAAVPRDQRRDGERVDVVDRRQRQRLPLPHHFVAGGEDRHDRLADDAHLIASDRRQRADPARRDRLTRAQDDVVRAHVRAAADDVLAGPRLGQHQHLLARVEPRRRRPVGGAGRPVSSTITTASAPSGIGAPVAISTQSPGASVPANGSAV